MLGDNIKKYRKENNISQEELAEKIGVSRQSISLWENGKANPGLDTITELASILGVPVGALIDSENIEEHKNDNGTQESTNKNNKVKKQSNKISKKESLLKIIIKILLSWANTIRAERLVRRQKN